MLLLLCNTARATFTSRCYARRVLARGENTGASSRDAVLKAPSATGPDTHACPGFCRVVRNPPYFRVASGYLNFALSSARHMCSGGKIIKNASDRPQEISQTLAARNINPLSHDSARSGTECVARGKIDSSLSLISLGNYVFHRSQ